MTAALVRCLSTFLCLVLILAGLLCLWSSVDAASEHITIEPFDDPASLPYRFDVLENHTHTDGNQKPTTGEFGSYQIDSSGEMAYYAITNNWLAVDTLTCIIFLEEPISGAVKSHHNIRTPRINSDLAFDFDNDGQSEIALTYNRHDSLFVNILGDGKGVLFTTCLLTGVDRNGSGNWDGRGYVVGACDVNGDGFPEILVTVDTGYDLYPRGIYCLDWQADSVLWSFSLSGICGPEDQVCVVGSPSESEARIVLGVSSKGNAAVAGEMNDQHSYLIVLSLQGEYQWSTITGGVFTTSCPTMIDYDGEGLPEVLVGHRPTDTDSTERNEFSSAASSVRVYSLEGTLFDSIKLPPGSWLRSSCLYDANSDGSPELFLSLNTNTILVCNQHLDVLTRIKFSSGVEVWGAEDYLGLGCSQILVWTDDRNLWLFDRAFAPLAQYRSPGSLNRYRSLVLDNLDGAPGKQLLLVNANRTTSVVTGWRKSPWGSVFSRRPSLAFWIAFLPMALLALGAHFAWIRVRRKNRIILEQRDRLDSTLSALQAAQDKLVAVDRFKKAQDALRVSEENFRHLAENSLQFIFVLQDGKYVFTNQLMANIAGVSRSEFLSRPPLEVITQLIHPDDRSLVTQCHEQNLNSNPSPASYEIRAHINDTEWGWLQLQSQAVVFNGKPAVLLVMVDITERKIAERNLSESEERYRSLVESALEAIFSVDWDGNYLFMNQVAAQRLGGTPEEFIGKNMFDLFPKSVANQHMTSIRKVIDAGRGEVFDNTTVLTSIERYYRTSLQPIRDHDGKVISVMGIGRDTTEHMQAQEALRRSEADFQELFTKISEGICVVDENEIVCFCNPTCAAIFEEDSVEQMVGKSLLDYVPDEYKMFLKEQTKIRVKGISSTYELPIIGVKGSRKFIRVSVSPKLADGQYVGAFGALRDITDRKLAEDALRQSESRFRELAELLPQTIFEMDPNGNFIFANRHGYQTFGYGPEDLEHGLNALTLFDENEASRIQQNISTAMQGEKPQDNEYLARRKDGTTFPVLVSSSPMTRDGKTTGLRGILVDITEQKESELALRHLVRFQELITTISTRFINPASGDFEREVKQALEEITRFIETDMSFVMILADDGKTFTDVISWNQDYITTTAAKIKGVSLDSLPWMQKELARFEDINLRSLDNLPPEATAERQLFETIGVVSHAQVPLIHGGRLIGGLGFQSKTRLMDWSSETLSLLRIAGEIFANAYEHLRNARKLRRVNRERYEQVKLIAGGVAHEIRNALFPAASSVQKLTEFRNGVSSVDPARETELLDLTRDAVRRAMKLTDLVGGFSRLGSQRSEDVIVLLPLLREICRDNRQRITDLGVDINLDVSEAHSVICSVEQAMSLFGNLLLNSLDALEEVSDREITISSKIHGEQVWIEFSDSGPGIPQDIQGKVFSAFFSTKPLTGTGMGLAIARRIVEVYDGRIDLDSSLDKGAKFVIFLKKGD